MVIWQYICCIYCCATEMAYVKIAGLFLSLLI